MNINEYMHSEIKDVIDNIETKSKENFELRKCITYLDEFEYKMINGIRAISLVSFSSLKKDYIKNLEPEWINIRKNFGFPAGTPIHFTSLRNILNKETYTNKQGTKITCDGWDEDYIKYQWASLKGAKNKEIKRFNEKYEMFCIFSKNNKEGSKVIDKNKIKDFFMAIIECIKNSNITINCTSYCYDSNILYKKDKTIHNENLKPPYLIAFLEHLNLLTFYLRHGFLTKEEIKENTLYKRHFSTKLRFDGDDGFNNKDDYRYAFNEAVISGTRLFSGKSVRETIDEIRFINKKEIGCSSIDSNIISHIGCDVADFLAYYVGMHILKDTIIDIALSKNDSITIEDAEASFYEMVTFKINDTKFDPFSSCLKDKIIYNKNGFSSYQYIKENHFYSLGLS